MKTWDVNSPDGQTWVVDAPDNIPEAAVIAYAQRNAASWENGGRYNIPAVADLPSQPGGMQSWTVNGPNQQIWTVDAPVGISEGEVIEYAQNHSANWKSGETYTVDQPKEGSRNEQADAKAKELLGQMARIRSEIEGSTTRRYAGPTLLGGTGTEATSAVTGMAPVKDTNERLQRRAELSAQLDALSKEYDTLVVGTRGQTIGGVTGSLLGGGLGAVVGGRAGGLPGMAVGGVLGSLVGGAAGVYKGTELKDIPEAQKTRDISDAEAAELIKARVIEAALWDGAFVLLFGPGGRVLGKLLDGTRLLPAIKAAVRDSVSWDTLKSAKKTQLEAVIEKRAAQAAPRAATQVTSALELPARMTDKEATEDILRIIAQRSGGRVPTEGEVRGLVTGVERFARKQAPEPFAVNEQILERTAEEIRRTALRDLDNVGAVGSYDLGIALRGVVESADRTLKRVTGPIFERAAQQNVTVDMRPTLKYLEHVLFQDLEAARALPAGERATLTMWRDALKEEPYMSAAGTQLFISGKKAAQRAIAPDGTKPSTAMNKTLADLVTLADTAFIGTLKQVRDPTLVRDLQSARALYRSTMTDLYGDAMATAAGHTPEDVGRALTPKGTVTEIRELRAALDRAVSGAPAKTRVRGGKVSELGKEAMDAERSRIDAGLIKGFIEKHTQSLTDISTKLRDPEFRVTLKELLTGPGVANPALGRKVLAELDRVAAVVKISAPEVAPQPGRINMPGVGGLGLGSAGAALTGSVQTAVPWLILFMGSTRVLGNMMASAMTTGNVGAFRNLQRALALAPAAGKNAAAAEALRGLLHELDAWDRQHGGAGVPEPQPQ